MGIKGLECWSWDTGTGRGNDRRCCVEFCGAECQTNDNEGLAANLNIHDPNLRTLFKICTEIHASLIQALASATATSSKALAFSSLSLVNL
jgi:hypothetical protein